MIVSVNPTTGTELARFEPQPRHEVDAALDAAVAAQARWRLRPITERVELLRVLARVLRAGRARYARLITAEMGKPIVEAEAEIDKCAWTCEHYAEHAATYLADRPVASSATRSMVVHDPLGVVLAIADVMRAAGTPDGLFHTLLIDVDQVAALIADDRIAAVTLTGSTQVGGIVASQAGAALKKEVLELGGSDPFIVLADADTPAAAATAVKARFVNVGQSCVNAKRFIVEGAVADDFVAAFTAGAAALKVGDPTEPDTAIGPMARANLRDALHDQVRRSVDAGATVCTGGEPADGPGFFYPPTVLDHVGPGMAAFDEETFGPVAAITRVADAEEAIALANRTPFGLGAALWTRDLERACRFARAIDAGAVFINGMVASDPRLPFGGVKKSGYGRELGAEGIREFVNIKTVWIGPPAAAPQPGDREAID